MHGGAAEDRSHHARKSRRPLSKKKQREKIHDLCRRHHAGEAGKRGRLHQGAKECIAETRKEKGCISYEGHTSINNPNLFVVVERWETREDLNAHGRAPHMKVWREYSAPLKAAPTVIEIISDGKVEKF